MSKQGSLTIYLLLLLSFTLLVALPTLQLAFIQYRAAIHSQVGLQTLYLAESGLIRARQLLRFDSSAPLPEGEQPLGNGSFSLMRQGGDGLVSIGRVGAYTTKLAITYEERALCEDYLLVVGGFGQSGDVVIEESAGVRVEGAAYVAGTVAGTNAAVGVTEELGTVTEGFGILCGDEEPFLHELCGWLEGCFVQSGVWLEVPAVGDIILQPGLTYLCEGCDWSGRRVRGPGWNEPAATLVVKGDLVWHDIFGHINLLVAGDCEQCQGVGQSEITGLVAVIGTFTVRSLRLQGVLVAGSLKVLSSGYGGDSLWLSIFPGYGRPPGLVVPCFANWRYYFD